MLSVWYLPSLVYSVASDIVLSSCFLLFLFCVSFGGEITILSCLSSSVADVLCSDYFSKECVCVCVCFDCWWQ